VKRCMLEESSQKTLVVCAVRLVGLFHQHVLKVSGKVKARLPYVARDSALPRASAQPEPREHIVRLPIATGLSAHCGYNEDRKSFHGVAARVSVVECP
jgi:hypothetical protein